VLGVGLSTGQIQILNGLSGEVSLTLNEGHTSAVNDITFAPDMKSLYTCGQDDWIVQWDLSTSLKTRYLSPPIYL
jgi:WD40 repeat protein